MVTTTNYLTGVGANGCIKADSVAVMKTTSLGSIDIPNTFSPNRDGKNDCFSVLMKGKADNYILMIYNRWGEKVFESRDPLECRNGKYKNIDAPIGNYVYHLTVNSLCGNVKKAGNILLIR